jgi:hypothetical protein
MQGAPVATVRSLQELAEAQEEHRVEREGGTTLDGTRFLPVPVPGRFIGGVTRDNVRFKKELCKKLIDSLGDDAWSYSIGKGYSCRRSKLFIGLFKLKKVFITTSLTRDATTGTYTIYSMGRLQKRRRREQKEDAGEEEGSASCNG